MKKSATLALSVLLSTNFLPLTALANVQTTAEDTPSSLINTGETPEMSSSEKGIDVEDVEVESEDFLDKEADETSAPVSEENELLPDSIEVTDLDESDEINGQTDVNNVSTSSEYLIPDEVLRKLVNSMLGKTTSYSPTIEELGSIKGTLSVVGASNSFVKVESWEGLEYLKGITGLQFMYVETSSDVLTKIKELASLERINFNTVTFTGNDSTMTVNGKSVGIQQEVDFSPLGELTNLEQLSMTYMNTEIKSATGYPRLKADFAGLSSLSKLKRIDIGQIGDTTDNHFNWLADIPSLETVYIYETPLNSVTSISMLPNLTSLNVAGNKISDFSSIVDKDYFTGASGNNYVMDTVSMYTDPDIGSRLVNIENLVTIGNIGMSSASIQRFSSYNNFSVKSTSFDSTALSGIIQMGDLISLNSYNWQTGQYDKWENSAKGTAIPYTVTTNNNKTISGYAYVGISDQSQAEIKVKDSTIYVGDDWSPEDNFVSAIGENGELLSEFDSEKIEVKGEVDTSKADQYTVTYSYDGVESQAVITVKDNENDLAHIVVHDSTLKVGDEWNPEDNFDEATDFQGNIEDFSKIIIEGSVDTTKVGIYEVTYKIPEEHWDRSLVEGYHSATAKIKVTEESTNNSEGVDNDDELDSSSDLNTSNTVNNVENSGKDKIENNLTLSDDKNDGVSEQNLPQTGENAMSSFFILVMGIALIISGLIMFLLLLRSRKRKTE